jgi:L-alanine-DL-glutamate epimerase-like enolase superfamily enzyme
LPKPRRNCPKSVKRVSPPIPRVNRTCGDLVLDELPVVDGRIPLPTKRGLGVTVNEETLKAFKVA